MGLDIGIITITHLERPDGVAYEFACQMAIEASVHGYMTGEGNNWAGFTQRQVLAMLDEFTEHRNLDASAKAEIRAWVQSLPWDGWRDDLTQDADEEGGLIEMHFNW
ncbi:MAG: hypothetical protein EXR55_06330 [Dehalococcoidia bacterium]|nr:hypothetical protein [Dehalococcoidia bacterium]